MELYDETEILYHHLFVHYFKSRETPVGGGRGVYLNYLILFGEGGGLVSYLKMKYKVS